MNRLLYVLVAIMMIVSCKDIQIGQEVIYSEGIISVPTLFAPGVISTDDQSEFTIAFSPDGRRAYFDRRAPEQKQKLYQSDFINGSWTTPTVCSFSTDRDEAASITADGKMLYFGSERSIPGRPSFGNFDMNIWKVEATEEGWGEPEPLPSPINEVQIEGEKWPSSNNNFLAEVEEDHFYFTTMMRDSSAIQLYETYLNDNEFSTPYEVKGIWDNDTNWVYSAVVSPDGKYLVFNSYGVEGGAGGEDIFISKRVEGGWSNARPIGNIINTADEESSPRFSRDGKYFFFSRATNLGNYEYGEWNIYFLNTEALGLDELYE